MLEDGRITYKQLMLLIIMSRFTIELTQFPLSDTPPANQDVWMSAVFSFPIHLLLVGPVYLLVQRFKDRSIIQCAEAILGKVGKLVGILYVWLFLHMTAITLREFGDFLTAVPYPETPILVFMISTAFFAAYAVRNGVEAISRIGEVVTPIVLGSIVLLVAMVAKDMRLEVFTPLFEKGVFPVFHGAFVIAARTTEILFLAMLLPYLNRPRMAKKAVILGFFVLALFTVIIIIAVVATFGVEQAKSRAFPFFSVVRIISIGDFLERVEVVHLGIWILGVFVKVAIYYYLAVLGAAQLLNLTDYRPIVLPIGTIIVSLSILQADSLIALREFLSRKIWPWYALFFMTALPLLLLIVAAIRGKGVRSK